ncbi:MULTISPECIES: hypothetical protein [Spiroplasma]|uniref:Spiroplasmavirus-related protein n=1 Tax=Spiroplasma ixodetis TaxID=2141 RepID=A0ABN6T063_9MOLU|nr:hypothetical protein [Spiroplasma ixodetis]BDT02941.1 hypothetical protein SHM_05870 [Spiroplasma ixodetis]BDT04668.1 hypothetical protein SHM_23140 [Spiroplasma ixodetis]
MKIKALKKLQLLTVLLFIFTILTLIIGLILIDFSHFNLFYLNKKLNCIDGFYMLKHFQLSFIIEHSAKYFYNFGTHHIKENFYEWTELRSGIFLVLFLLPILFFITISLTFFIIGFKTKLKNNNFWDAIQNCEIINNYYIH